MHALFASRLRVVPTLAAIACVAGWMTPQTVDQAFAQQGPGLASAGCSRSSSFHLTSEGPWSGTMLTRSGQPCGGGFFGGSIRFKRLYLATPPQSGTVSLREGGYYAYKSNPGYRGPDSFTLRICGVELNVEGCANVRYAVTVQ